MKSILLWSGVGVLVVAGLVAVVTFADPQQSSPSGRGGEASALSVPVNNKDHGKGNLNSSISLVEYGDFQCPACRSYFPIVSQVEQEFGDRIAIVFRHFPLRTIHANAEYAARASEAAALQGKFWEMHDMLFDKQNEWAKKGNAEDIFAEYAESLGLNKDQFQQDLQSSEVEDSVQEDLLAALQDGVQSTPSFFLAGKKLVNPQSYEAFRQTILDALAEHAEPEQQAEPEEPNEDSTETDS